MKQPTILLVEDRDSLRRLLRRALEADGCHIEEAEDGLAGIEKIDRGTYDLVLTDLKLPGASGLEVLRACRKAQSKTPVVVMTAYGTVANAVEAMKLGAFDFLEKPVEVDDLLSLVRMALGNEEQDAALEAPGAPPIIGRHPELRTAVQLLRRVAGTESTVLLTGESGTGKELFARALHALSKRSTGPFVGVNCAALPESLMENELFGHEKGAFTGANRRHAGKFEVAKGGTLLLDEIGELALGVQAKILRVLEERTFERVGGSSTLHADIRLVAATNRDLQEMVSEGSFRADLYYRLEVFPLELPPLRRRLSDIPLLARHLLSRICERNGKALLVLTPEAETLLSEQPWPGNIRELANLLERASILTEGNRLDTPHLKPLMKVRSKDLQQHQLRQALVDSNGNKRAAAQALGISYRTLLRRVRLFDLEGFPTYRD
ncbi:MAG: sigma-54 dependent transcriptional regulator [Deltaproteobacteria bacterium]|nr:sigma-54 dependent transcriptional regulator [Deltaproteobacteria bacterium]